MGARWAWLAVCSQLVVPLYALVGALGAPALVRKVGGRCRKLQWQAARAPSWGRDFHSLHGGGAKLRIDLGFGLHWTRRSREELALMDGGNANLIRRVLLPEMRGWIAAAAFWAMVPC